MLLAVTVLALIPLTPNPLRAEDAKIQAPAAAPAAPANIAIIYDLSNSMWAKLNGEAKLNLAQNALIKSLTSFDKRINLGITSYGHAEKTGCTSVEETYKFSPLNAETAISALKPQRPKGNAPIGKALLDTANMIADRAAPFKIILIADGPSNCPIDPCATAASLKGAMPTLTIDVLALGAPTDKSLDDLACIAEPSNGLFTKVDSAAALSTVLNTSITHSIKVAAGEKREQPDQEQIAEWAGATEIITTPEEKSVTGAVAEEDQKPKDKFSDAGAKENKTHGGLALVASLIDNGPIIKSGITWRIYTEKPNKLSGKHKLISAHRTAEPVMSLPAGKYLINAAMGRAFLTRKVEIVKGENKTENFVLNAGGLRIATVLANGTPIPDNTVTFDIFSDERDQYGKRLKVLGKVRPGLVVRLNSGIYHVVSTYGDANAQSRADVSVEAGKLTEATIDHHSAKVTFKLVYKKGGEALADTKWSLLSPRGNIIKKSAGALPTHFLAAGDYTILAERGKKKYSQTFSVNPGDQKQIEVIIQ